MKDNFLFNQRFIFAAPEIVNPSEFEREKSAPENRLLSATINDIQSLDNEFSERSTAAMRRLLDIEDRFNRQVESLDPTKREVLKARIDYVKSLIDALTKSDNFSIDEWKYRADPQVFKEKLIQEQQSLQALLDRFGVVGLRLTQTSLSARSRVEYGVSLNGRNLGNIIFVEGLGREPNPEAQLIDQISTLLDSHGISYTKVESTEFANLPYRIDVQGETLVFLRDMGMRVAKDRIEGVYLNGGPVNFRWDEPVTQNVEIKILDRGSRMWQVTVRDFDGKTDIATLRGRDIINTQDNL